MTAMATTTRRHLAWASGFLCAVLLTAHPGTDGAKAQEEYLLRIGHDTVEDYQDALARHFAEEVERESDGRIAVEIYPANQLGSNESMNQQVRTGALQGIIQPSAFLTPVAPVLGVLDLPFLFPNEDVQNTVLNSKAAELLNEALREEGYEPVAWMTGGFKQFNTTFPVRKASDFDGRIYRTMTSPILVHQYESWGASVTTMSFSEVYTALQQGTIEGHENPPDAIYHRKLHEVAPYLTISDHGALTTVLTLSKRWYDQLPADLQQVLQQAGKSTAKKSSELLEPFHQASLKAMEADGTEIIYLDEQERQKLREMAAPVWDHVAKDPVMGSALEALKAEVAKHL